MSNGYVTVLSGDIISSQQWDTPAVWLETLQASLSGYGKEGEDWDIYWGDGFQLRIADPLNCFTEFLKIKSILRSTHGVDARIGIGIAPTETEDVKIKYSHGLAYVLAAKAMKKANTLTGRLTILTADDVLNSFLAKTLPLAALAYDTWKPATASVVHTLVSNPEFVQQQIGEHLGIRQSTVHGHIKRSYIERLLQYDEYLRTFIAERLHI